MHTTAFGAHSRLTQETFGNGLISQRTYNHETGDLETIQTGTGTNPTAVQNSGFTFDALDNLTARSWWDGTALRSETLGYDTLNRLTTVTGPANKTYAYAPNGNIQSKTGVGTYSYTGTGCTRPHAVCSITGTVNTSFIYDANGNLLTGNGRTISYYSFNKPKTIAGASGTTTLTYDAHFNRLIKAAPGGTTTYLGKLYEKFVSGSTTTQRHYIYAGNNLVGAYSTVNTTPTTRYFHTDHLGSIEVITDEAGNVVQRLSYDAFGKRRNPNGTDATTITAQTTRGFTRHEHDDEVTLINMNAREYDPLLGRFITPDTVVPGAGNSQSYNRYSYVNNNPLSMTDPTGHGWNPFKSISRAVRSVTRAVHRLGETIERNAPSVYRAYARYQVASAYVAAGFYAGGPTGAIAGARAFYESNKVYNAGGNTGDILTTGAASGVGTYFTLEGLGGMYDSWINGIVQTQSVTLATAKVAGQQYVNAQFRDAVGNYAARQGYSLTEFNLGLFGFSALGNGLAGSRLKSGGWENTEWGIRGFGQRTNPIIGLPFDVVDTVLAFQGLPTATAVQYIFSSQRGMPLTGHSLGALDVANLSGFGLAGTSSRVYALPFGKVASGAGVTIGSGDFFNGFSIGTLFNPDAAVVDTGFLGHRCSLYSGCGQ
jgi:RHS repeat-associated protein